jgi:1,4-dihydroxy-2-naphthoate octaprenyltransferase
MTMKSWLLAARPKTLSASVVPVLMGTALAPFPPKWLIFACALAGALFIQIGTNLVNDALDFRKGADTSERVGPIRVTQAGLLSAERVLLAAYVCFGIAAVFGIPLILRGGWPLLAIGVASIIAAYAYTGGPYPLAYNGLGEIFVMAFFGVVAVGGSFYVQTLTLDRAVNIAGVAAGSLATVLLVINNLRDVPSDARTGKRTMAVRFGEGFARGEAIFFALLPFACTIVIAVIRGKSRLLLPLGALPLAVFVILRVFRSSGAELNRSLAMAGALQWAFGILFMIGSLMPDLGPR